MSLMFNAGTCATYNEVAGFCVDCSVKIARYLGIASNEASILSAGSRRPSPGGM